MSEPDQRKDAGQEPYGLEPEAPRPAAPPPTAHPPRGEITEPPLLDAFDDDADFSADPEVERALSGGGDPTPPDEQQPGAPPRPALVTPGRGAPRTIAVVGGLVMIGAMAMAGWNAQTRWYAASLSVGYLTVLHAGTGVLAVALAAHLHGLTLGRLDLAASRMLLATAAFMLTVSAAIPGPAALSRAVMTLAGAVVYVAVIAFLFRLRTDRLRAVVVSHAAIAIALYLVVAVHVWASAGPESP